MKRHSGFLLSVLVWLCILGLMALPADAVTTALTGIVLETGRPVAGASVTLRGNNLTMHRVTDSNGRFSFQGLDIGTYEVTAQFGMATGHAVVDLTTSGVNVSIDMLRTIAVVSSGAQASLRGSGTDLMFTANLLARSPAGRDLAGLLLQTPGAARGANGVVHMNGDHGDINYIVDGVPIPQELNRQIGGEFDTSDMAFVEVLQGAYPAQYGDRFASVVNITTVGGTGKPGAEGHLSAGSFGLVDASLTYHAPLGRGSVVVGLRNERSDRFLDPPNPDSPHNAGGSANQFFRYTIPFSASFLNITLSHSNRAVQIPNDVFSGEPESTDDNERQDDLFAALQVHRTFVNAALSYGLGLKRSRIRDLPDPANDIIFGENLNLASGGASTDCANGTVSACAYSLYSDRVAHDVRLNVDDVVTSSHHEVRWGASHDSSSVDKTYAVTLQPGNFLAPLFTPATPEGAFTVTDAAPNTGYTSDLYLQDSWKMGTAYQLDYGVRYDRFAVTSAEFARTFTQVSPRVKLTRLLGSRAGVYAYYGRFFTPFSLENVSPSAAHLLNLPNQPAIAAFDLRPQRDSVYEVGGNVLLGAGRLGVRIMQKNATDLIDDTQVGVTSLHQDINYAQGRIASQSAYYQRNLIRGGRLYVSATHTRSVNKGCETQLLAPCFGAPADWTPADHDQRWDLNGGVLLNEARGGWFSLSGEYGSGLSSAFCDASIAVCKVPPHLMFDIEKGVYIGSGVSVTAKIGNLFDDRYRITYLNAQGNHYAEPRSVEIGLSLTPR
jgi:hypothetical protein